MKEMISKEKAIETLTQAAKDLSADLWEWEGSTTYCDAVENLADCLDDLPDETRRGKWIKTRADMIAVKDESKVWWRCSCCNSPALMGRLTIYCPNCGAEMAVGRE